MDDTNDAICFNKMFFKGCVHYFSLSRSRVAEEIEEWTMWCFLVNVYSYCSFVYSIVFIKDDLDVSRGDY